MKLVGGVMLLKGWVWLGEDAAESRGEDGENLCGSGGGLG